MKISISIVTYNSEDEIRTVLNCLKYSDCNEFITIYIVDNGSIDNTKKIIKEEYKDCVLIESDNVGYGAGHNKAINMINSDYHFILNPDIKFDSCLLSNIVNWFEKNPECVMATPDMYDMNGSKTYPPKRNPCLKYLIARYLKKKLPFMIKWEHEYIEYDNNCLIPYPIEICSGAFMACNTKALKFIKGFDEIFFMYFEDFDLSRRMNNIGSVMCLPQFKFNHEGKRDAHHSKVARHLMIKSMIKYFQKWGLKIL